MAVTTEPTGVGVFPLELLAGPGIVLSVSLVLHRVYMYIHMYKGVTLPLALPCTVQCYSFDDVQ